MEQVELRESSGGIEKANLVQQNLMRPGLPGFSANRHQLNLETKSIKFTRKTFTDFFTNKKRATTEKRFLNRVEVLDIFWARHTSPISMVYIPEGGFSFGEPDTQRFRNIHMPFYMSCYPITQIQWKEMSEMVIFLFSNSFLLNYEQTKSVRDVFGSLITNPSPSYFEGDHRPVEKVSWFDAYKYCEALSALTSLTFRLPSEVEWEYACRAGTTSPFYCGDFIDSELSISLEDGDGEEHTSYTHDVFNHEKTGIKFLPNQFGLYHMSGNVAEWCMDDWKDSKKPPSTDSTLTKKSTESEQLKVVRGGSHIHRKGDLKVFKRDYLSSNARSSATGFRIILEPYSKIG